MNEIRGAEILQTLLQDQPDLVITEESVRTAALIEIRGGDIIQALLKHRPDVVFTEEIVKAAVSNKRSGAEILQSLLQHQPDLVITEEIVKAAVLNEIHGAEILQTLLQHQPDLGITEEIVKAALTNERSSAHVMNNLLDHRPALRSLLDWWVEAPGTDYCKAIDRLVRADYRDTVLIEWQLPDFVERSFGNDQSLGTLFAITGSGATAFAATCEQYIKLRWRPLGLWTFGTVSIALHRDTAETFAEDAQF